MTKTVGHSTFKHRKLNLAGAALAVGAVLSFGIGMALADDVTSSDIVRALSGPKKPLTRGLSVGAPAASSGDQTFVDTLRNRTSRSLSSGEREQIATIAKDKPNIDLEITFDFNSAKISRKAEPMVDALGKALSSPDLKGSTFVVAGHTDNVGGDAFNQDLSERRADTIKKTLIERYGIAGADLVTVGYGKSKPKDPTNPADAANRRVQVVNMTSQNTASK